jgi:hypothetical protein
VSAAPTIGDDLDLRHKHMLGARPKPPGLRLGVRFKRGPVQGMSCVKRAVSFPKLQVTLQLQ